MNVFKLKPGSRWMAIYSATRTNQVMPDEFHGRSWLGTIRHGLFLSFDHHTYEMANAPRHINKAHTRRHSIADPRAIPTLEHRGDHV